MIVDSGLLFWATLYTDTVKLSSPRIFWIGENISNISAIRLSLIVVKFCSKMHGLTLPPLGSVFGKSDWLLN